MLCGDLEGCDGECWRRSEKEAICICIDDSLCYAAESNKGAVKQLYSNKKKKQSRNFKN